MVPRKPAPTHIHTLPLPLSHLHSLSHTLFTQELISNAETVAALKSGQHDATAQHGTAQHGTAQQRHTLPVQRAVLAACGVAGQVRDAYQEQLAGAAGALVQAMHVYEAANQQVGGWGGGCIWV